jgi:peptidoglycan/LPS O-acetylase OafA/YrhL
MLVTDDPGLLETPGGRDGVPAEIRHPRSHLAALDGLRFVAAAFVLIAHGYHYLIILQDNSKITSYNAPVLALSTIGMTLFFVLSGFVIHYNYAASVSLPGGIRSFFVARFARLYPLFLLVFMIETVRLLRHPDGRTDLFGPLPFFLTFTQSWWFWSSGERVAYEAYSNATGMMWSLSTEAFFYLLYPAIGRYVRRLSGGRLLITGATVAAIGAFLTFQVVNHVGQLTEFAQIYVGNAQTAPQFAHWLFFNSPWLRLFEFLLGAFAAQYVMSTGMTARTARLACGAALVVLASAYFYTNVALIPLSGGITTILCGVIAIVVATSAASQHGLARIMSSRWMVRGGEASYSLYLLHYWVMHDLGHRLADPRPVGIRAVLFVVLMAAAVAVAQVSYRFFEKPTTRLVRKALSAPRQAPVGDAHGARGRLVAGGA